MKYRLRLKTFTVAEAPTPYYSALDGPESAARLIETMLADLDATHEHLGVICLDARHQPRGFKVLFTGSERQSVATPAAILRAVLVMGFEAFILFHNHPTGHVEPSADDTATTHRVRAGASNCGLNMLDHIIVSPKNTGRDTMAWYSFSKEGRL